MMIKALFSSTILILFLFSVSFSQEKNAVDSKNIAFIDRNQFYLEETGIRRINQAYKLVHYHSPSFKKIAQLTEELKKPNLLSAERTEKETLLKKLRDDGFKEFERREKILLEPILIDITYRIQQLEVRNNLKILFSDELIRNRGLLFIDKELEITKQFISHFNDSENVSNKLDIDVPESNFAFVKTNAFFLEFGGINKLAKELREIEPIINKASESQTNAEKLQIKNYFLFTAKVGEEIGNFSKTKGFNIVFDRSKKLPQNILDSNSQDITNEFIEYFNNKYK